MRILVTVSKYSLTQPLLRAIWIHLLQGALQPEQQTASKKSPKVLILDSFVWWKRGKKTGKNLRKSNRRAIDVMCTDIRVPLKAFLKATSTLQCVLGSCITVTHLKSCWNKCRTHLNGELMMKITRVAFNYSLCQTNDKLQLSLWGLLRSGNSNRKLIWHSFSLLIQQQNTHHDLHGFSTHTDAQTQRVSSWNKNSEYWAVMNEMWFTHLSLKLLSCQTAVCEWATSVQSSLRRGR